MRDWRSSSGTPRPFESWLGVGLVLSEEIRRLGLEEGLLSVKLLDVWPSVVGSFIASHSKPETLKDHILHVRVLQSTLRYELERNLRKTIIKRLNEELGGIFIREIKFLHG